MSESRSDDRTVINAWALPAFDLQRRVRAGCLHLVISLGIAALAAALVFNLWYPGPFKNLSGGTELFVLVATIDVILGPLLTFLVFDLRKGVAHLRRDLAVIGFIQLTALLYGVHVVYMARPVALVFEGDRFRVVTAIDVYELDLPKASVEYQTLSLTGPLLLGLREIREGDELKEAIRLEMEGVAFAARPIFWQPYDMSRQAVVRAARPIGLLLDRYPTLSKSFNERTGSESAATSFVPVFARAPWVALIRTDGTIVGYENVDGFFE
jgi:hypothetical protein